MSFEFNVRMGEKGFGFTLSVDGITMAQVDQVATMIENVLTSKKDDIARILKEGADKINEAVEKAKKAEDKTGTEDKEGGFDDKICKDKDDTEGGEEDINDIKKEIISKYISSAGSKKEINKESGERAKHLIAGKTFVVSGNCMYFKSKKVLEDYILKHEGIIQNGVDNDTDYLISSYNNTFACKSAREKGIPVYNEQQFLLDFYQYMDLNEYLKRSFVFSKDDCTKSF